ncbi:MAG TPA: multifunctional CCA addition/repair protein [Methylibium sp.]|nr:multifunctional CCA addition/repair protein [Methylibium sp.]
MELYEVGGAVRDALLGRPAGDRDWVAVGATPEQLIAAGYLPVGRDFPVFLHPVTREEVALARTERKTAPGYHGFLFHAAPEVTLEEDLARRDLTINAIARAADGRLIDPYGGQRDLAARVLRHVSPAFAEDPVRILRLARFAARFADFTVAPETEVLLRSMVEAGEVDALVPERVWQELSRGLMEATPSRMFELLRGCGALARLLPEVDRLWGVPQRAEHHPEVDTGSAAAVPPQTQARHAAAALIAAGLRSPDGGPLPSCGDHLLLVLDLAARLDAPLAVRYACLGHDLGKGTTPAALWPCHDGHEGRSVALLRALGERLRVPNDCRELAEVVAREHGNLHRSAPFGAAALLRLLERCDALRKPQRFEQILLACECDARGRAGFAETAYAPAPRLRAALAAAQAVDTAAVAAAAAARGAAGPAVGAAIHAEREAAIAAALALPGPAA